MVTRRVFFLGVLLCLLCTAAVAQNAWVKYQHTSANPPAFTVEYPSGWPVTISEHVDDFLLEKTIFPGKLQVSFQSVAGMEPLRCGVAVYGIPNNASGTDMQMLITGLGLGAQMTTNKLHGQDYLEATIQAGNRTIWRSCFTGEHHFYVVSMDLPSAMVRQSPACRQSYLAMVRSFTAPDWPLKAPAQTTTVELLPLTIINNGQHALYISLIENGNKNERSVQPGRIWILTLPPGTWGGYWGSFAKGGKLVSGTAIASDSGDLREPETWVFQETTMADNKTVQWSRQKQAPPHAADALNSWLSYVQGDPSFVLDIPGGWTVIGGDTATSMTCDALTTTPLTKVSFEYGQKPNLVHAGITAYSASTDIDVPKVQQLLAAQPTSALTAPPKRSVKQLNGHNYLLEENTTLTTFSWNSYLPIDKTLYVLTFEGPLADVKQGEYCFQHMAESFRSNSWQPIQPPTTPATTPPASTAKPGAANATAGAGAVTK